LYGKRVGVAIGAIMVVETLLEIIKGPGATRVSFCGDVNAANVTLRGITGLEME
jgi:hypothetical protein